MLTPNLLALHAAAVAVQAPRRAALEAGYRDTIDAHCKAAQLRLDKVVNALERGDVDAIKSAMRTDSGQFYAPTDEEEAFFSAVYEVVFPAPEGVSPVTPATIVAAAPTAPPPVIQIPPQSPPADAPVPAVAEPKIEKIEPTEDERKPGFFAGLLGKG